MKAARDRNHNGQFTRKGEALREVRTIRATQETWDWLGDIAYGENCSRADALENLVENYFANLPEGEVEGEDTLGNLEQATALLEEALDLKANAGGAIKERIRKALALLGT